MPRPKGLSKTGGRIKGTPNKNTLDLQEKLLSSGVDVGNNLLYRQHNREEIKVLAIL